MADSNASLCHVTQVFSGCGKPMLGRRRRDTTELEFESLQFGRSETDHNGDNTDVPTLDKLVKDIREKVQCKIFVFVVHFTPHSKMYVVTDGIVTHC
jgi:hypothetical protein